MNLGAQKGWLATAGMRPIDISITAMGSFMLQSVVLSDNGKWFLYCIMEASNYLGVQYHELVAAMLMLQKRISCSYCYWQWHPRAHKGLWTLACVTSAHAMAFFHECSRL
jgi:hypothetical protein